VGEAAVCSHFSAGQDARLYVSQDGRRYRMADATFTPRPQDERQ
jgi:hypothetical protein